MWEFFRNIVPLSSLNPEEEEKKNMSFYEEKKKRKLHEEIETEKEKRIKLENCKVVTVRSSHHICGFELDLLGILKTVK